MSVSCPCGWSGSRDLADEHDCDLDDEREPGICPTCNGSGEGTISTWCHACKGSGER